jgi:hypothetical protein
MCLIMLRHYYPKLQSLIYIGLHLSNSPEIYQI